MSKIRMAAIDPAKLQKILAERGISPSKASKEIGFNPDYISSSLFKGCISKIAIASLELRYGIKYEDFCPEEPKAEQQTIQPEMNHERKTPEQLELVPDDKRKSKSDVIIETDNGTFVSFTVNREFWYDLYSVIFDAVQDAMKGDSNG